MWRQDVDHSDFLQSLRKLNAIDLELVNNILSHHLTCVSSDTPFGFSLQPEGQPKRAEIFIKTPLSDRTPGNLLHVQELLGMYQQEYLAERCLPYVILAGDQQTFERLWTIKNAQPGEYQWLIPQVGLFHFYWHVIKAILSLWWAQLEPFVIKLDRRQVQKQAKYFQACDFFLFQFVTVQHTFLMQLFSEYQAKQKAPANTFLHFLQLLSEQDVELYHIAYMYYYHTAPYFYFRAAIRAGRSEEIRRLIQYFLHLFLATNKRKYAKLCVVFEFTLQTLNPAIVPAMLGTLVGSLSGQPLTNIPSDLILERINRAAKVMNPSRVAVPSQIIKSIPSINITSIALAQLKDSLSLYTTAAQRSQAIGAPEEREVLLQFFTSRFSSTYAGLMRKRKQANLPAQSPVNRVDTINTSVANYFESQAKTFFAFLDTDVDEDADDGDEENEDSGGDDDE